MLIKQLIF